MLTAERLRELLDYDPETGLFHWRADRCRMAKHGQQAGRKKDSGYVSIHIGGHEYRAHRLAWLHVHGQWPEAEIDHINRCRDDNRIANLREATRTQNAGNRVRYRNNKSGFKGVVWHRKARRWCAGIRLSGVSRHLGLFGTPEEAHAAYLKAAEATFGQYARGE